mgnify:CR=1 FL=1
MKRPFEAYALRGMGTEKPLVDNLLHSFNSLGDTTMQTDPTPEHGWLMRLAGDWTYAAACPGNESKETPPWTESVRPMGDLWVVARGGGKMPDGSTADTLMTLGYDPARQRFVGTWAGSMAAYLWVYEGTLDESGTTLTLDTEGPNFMANDGSMTRFQDIITLTPDGQRSFTARMLGADGAWTTIMTADYHRTA